MEVPQELKYVLDVLGIILNITNIVVLLKSEMKSSATGMLVALACFDIGFLLCFEILGILPEWNENWFVVIGGIASTMCKKWFD